jgi:hypothetical protein
MRRAVSSCGRPGGAPRQFLCLDAGQPQCIGCSAAGVAGLEGLPKRVGAAGLHAAHVGQKPAVRKRHGVGGDRGGVNHGCLCGLNKARSVKPAGADKGTADAPAVARARPPADAAGLAQRNQANAGAGLCMSAPLHYTGAALANLGRGLGGPLLWRSSRAGFPFAAFCCAVRSSSTVGRSGRGVSPCRFQSPVRQPRTSCHPHLAVRVSGCLTCHFGAIMADAPRGASAPIPSPVQGNSQSTTHHCSEPAGGLEPLPASGNGETGAVRDGGNEMTIEIWRSFWGFWEYKGTRAQLEAEGVVPAGSEWPNGRQSLYWQAGGLSFCLRRARLEGRKCPSKVGVYGDWWSLRCDMRSGPDTKALIILEKQRELAETIRVFSPAGQQEIKAEFDRYLATTKDQAFQAFKAKIPGLVRAKRGRKPKGPQADESAKGGAA